MHGKQIKLPLLTGRIICSTSKYAASGTYAIAGVAYDESLLVRLYDSAEMNTVLYHKCYKLCQPITYDLPKGLAGTTAYADISNLLRKDTVLIKKLLTSQKEIPPTKLSKADIHNITALIKAEDTIPEYIKCKFLAIN